MYIILYSNILDILRGIGEARSNKLDLQLPQTKDPNEGEPESDQVMKVGNLLQNALKGSITIKKVELGLTNRTCNCQRRKMLMRVNQ